MAQFRKWSTAAALGAAVGLVGVTGVGAGVAGAGTTNPFRHVAPAVKPGAAVVPGTYDWILDRTNYGPITFTASNMWSASYDGDGGEWVQGGKAFAMDMTSGTDAPAGCLFAAKVGPGGTSIVKGTFSCTNDATGIWSVAPAPSAAPAATHGRVFAAHGVAPRTSLVLGSYKWFIHGAKAGTITYAADNAWSSTYTGDGGFWVQSRKTVAMAMTAGNDRTGGCIFAGKVNTTGTGIGTATAPGAWVCPGFSSSGTWYVK